jgi:hypothetical protein
VVLSIHCGLTPAERSSMTAGVRSVVSHTRLHASLDTRHRRQVDGHGIKSQTLDKASRKLDTNKIDC